jgi:RimJ/RimL family protein N-acetyltransferase
MIEGRRVRLRSFELSDVRIILKHWNNLALRNLMGKAHEGPVCYEEEEKWIRQTWKLRRNRKAFIFAIESIDDKVLVGGISLINKDWTSRFAVFGLCIYDPKNQGKGYGTEAARLAQEFYYKLRFKKVGSRRKARFIDGNYHDDIIMDILREEWLAGSK